MATAPHSHDRDPGEPALFGAVLASVSRSFYLTIRVLPVALRRPIGLAYLLARVTDTVADSGAVPCETRLETLRGLGQAIRGTGAVPELDALQAGVPEASERTLLGHTGRLIDLLEQTAPGDREEIRWVLAEILRGQTLDIQRFPTCGSTEVRALASAAELDDYTYGVAGCVGEFWTRICQRHLKNYSTKDASELVRLGIAFGKGLQLVNILRDAPADLANGRCYLPADELGIDPAALRETPALARPVFAQWLARAREKLDEGFRYLEAVRPWRLRLACFLPWALAVRTLDLIEAQPPLETPGRVKVSRREVRRLLVLGLLAATSNKLLIACAARVSDRRVKEL